jgi:hypothetical protein
MNKKITFAKMKAAEYFYPAALYEKALPQLIFNWP